MAGFFSPVFFASSMGAAYSGHPRPHHPVMAAHDFNRRQTIFMSFRVILSNTTSLSSFPCADICVQGSANVRAFDLDDLSRSVTRTRSSCASTANNEAGEDAVRLKGKSDQLNFEERVKFSEQNSENLMKIAGNIS